MPRIIVLFLTLFFLADHAVAQEEGLPKEAYLEHPLQRTNFDRDQWTALKSGIDYSRDPESGKPDSWPKPNDLSGRSNFFLVLELGCTTFEHYVQHMAKDPSSPGVCILSVTQLYI